MNRRQLLVSGAALGALGVLPVRSAFAADRIDVFTSSDSNVSDWIANSVKPAFEAANPDLTINIVITRGAGGGGLAAIADRAFAAFQQKADPQVDFFEGFNELNPKGAIEAGLWTKFDESNLPSYGKVNKLGIETAYGLPYRGSQVLLAYDSTKVKEAPTTWEALTAWIKANPGQFIYNRPDKGGSGQNFVKRAIHEANGRDPSLFTVANFSKESADKMLPGAWKILSDLAPSLYDNGAYTAGNTPTLQLLANGAVSMVPAWSDQALQGLAQGVLPPTIKLVQLQDLALCGGFTHVTIPTNAAHQAGALKFAEFLLSEAVQTSVLKDLGGFPGVDWSNLPADLRTQYADVIPASIPTFPSGDWETAMVDGWYRNVAPNVNRG
ncbi:extracellular solute-binding protein [Kaistia dalseonensis]|uniref:extracellular solute-binding protein n=1 Tax=Kaistia dalseonensis TaxID=410840 RepID=UPI0027D80E7A|nr:extracellular solute-binding protein [Kaistia dalseonensis]